MPRGKKPRRQKPTQSENLALFAGRIEQCTVRWLDDYEERRAALMEAFDELKDRVHDGTETTELLKLAGRLSTVHRQLTASESDMLKFASIREQIAVAKGVSHLVGPEDRSVKNLTLNFAPGTPEEQKAQMERMFLAAVSGKPVEALPPVIEAKAEVA